MFILSLVCVLASASVVLSPYSSLMEKLRELDFDPNIPKSEYVSVLATQSVDILLDLRTCLFNHAAESTLISLLVMSWSVTDSRCLVSP